MTTADHVRAQELATYRHGSRRKSQTPIVKVPRDEFVATLILVYTNQGMSPDAARARAEDVATRTYQEIARGNVR